VKTVDKVYMECDFCKFRKWVIRVKGQWLCDACRRTDLTDKQKLGNRMYPTR
jgi:ribosomal protein L37AE/L43A